MSLYWRVKSDHFDPDKPLCFLDIDGVLNSVTWVKSELFRKLRTERIDKLGVEEKEVTPTASFTNDLGADSLDTVELIMEFEKEFNISIPDEIADKIVTVGEVEKCISNILTKKLI
mgnify:CR=1 FL=1